ncbi:hypothetical protein BDV40DRAFT_131293 [Aspergillus tamarii]|uniref:Uncharacterized protein n=1 Tax=Aspergillus tamarii TaxID=41984 RepID=A0A5N6VAJ6_ASPTM|nr:hypothetical protein BDV40DRAFT_131293 [Aspergillus tamarii]
MLGMTSACASCFKFISDCSLPCLIQSWYGSASLGVEHLIGAHALFRAQILLAIAIREVILFWRSFVMSPLQNLAQYVRLDTVRRARMIIMGTWKRGEQIT